MKTVAVPCAASIGNIAMNADDPIHFLCLSPAGGSAGSLRPLVADLHPRIATTCHEYPGHGGRWNEPLRRSIASLVDDVVDHVPVDRPVIAFGHSMGAVVAIEVCRRLAAGGLLVRGLILSAHRAPDVKARNPPLHALPDDRLVDRLADLGGTDQALLDNADLMEVLLPIFRADLTAIERFDAGPRNPLPIPIFTYLGEDDPFVRSSDMMPWSAETSGPCRHRSFPGGHFYPMHDLAAFRRTIVEDTLNLASSGMVDQMR